MIFISYRIADALDAVRSLEEGLTREFGPGAVFWDKSQLAGGQVWTDELGANAKARRVMLVVIGPTWQTATEAIDPAWRNVPRLFNPHDWVRKEITLALDAGNVVVPVLLNGTAMPAEAWLRNCGLDRLHKVQGVPFRVTDHAADLAAIIALVRKHCPELKPVAPAAPPKLWHPAVLYPLQPAQHFAGREGLLGELARWAVAADDPVRVRAPDAAVGTVRVRALVAAGGTGKTALAERVLASVPEENPFGVFVWSFYENPQTEAFLRAACEYFLGSAPAETGGLLERLQQGLRADGLPHLLILDGLELVQASGATGRPRGELEDPLMRRLLRWVAAGRGTRAKALVTSRFPLPDLEDWRGHGFLPTDLDDLDPAAARSLLRRRGVGGGDAVLDSLAASVGRHALTVDVLASYLVTFCGGDPAHAPSFDPKLLADTDLKTARLNRVLTGYAERLPPRERDLLTRLSLFPRGAAEDVLGYLTRERADVAGSLAGCSSIELRKLLERLRSLGLVFRYQSGPWATYTSHPFLRDFFAGLLGTDDPRRVFEVVRSHLASALEWGGDEEMAGLSLVARPRTPHRPRRPDELDRYERLIEVTRLAGRAEDAYELFAGRLGGHPWLCWELGEYERALRIVSGFAAGGTPDTLHPGLSEGRRAQVAQVWGLISYWLGDLRTALACLGLAEERGRATARGAFVSGVLRDLIQVRYAAGHFPAAHAAAAAAWEAAGPRPPDERPGWLPTHLGAALFALGRVAEADEALARGGRPDPATNSEPVAVERLLRLGRPRDAAAEAEQAGRGSSRTRAGAARSALVLARARAEAGVPGAPALLASARAFVSHSGNVPFALRAHHAAAVIARCGGDLGAAAAEALDGIQLADSCGFGRWSLDIRLELARIYLAAGEPAKVIEPAGWVLDWSRKPDCQYAWGVADALHLLGVAHARLGDAAKTREHLREALAARRPLGHPGLAETEAELARLGSE